MKRLFDFLLGVPLLKLIAGFKKRKPPSSSGLPHKILIIKLAAVGDTILLVPVLRELRKKLPQAEIHWLVSSVNASLAQTVPYVDRVIVWTPVSPWGVPALVRELKKETYDTVIDLEQWARMTALISFFTGASQRIGFDTPGQHRAALYTDPVPKSSRQHEIKDFYAAVSRVVPLPLNLDLELFETEKGQSEAGQWEKELSPLKDRPLVLLHPGCGADGLPREWPLSEYALIGNWLIRTYRARLVLTAGPEEVFKTQRLKKLLNHQALDLGGRISWQGTVSLIKKVDLVVSGNTGVMHLAAAFKKPQVALHGPTDPTIWGPLNSHAVIVSSPCPQCPCLKLGFEYHRKDQSCMAQIGSAEVKKAISSLLGNS